MSNNVLHTIHLVNESTCESLNYLHNLDIEIIMTVKYTYLMYYVKRVRTLWPLNSYDREIACKIVLFQLRAGMSLIVRFHSMVSAGFKDAN